MGLLGWLFGKSSGSSDSHWQEANSSWLSEPSTGEPPDWAEAVNAISTVETESEASLQLIAEVAEAGALQKLFYLTSPSQGLIAATERELIQVIGFGPIFLTTRLAYAEIRSLSFIDAMDEGLCLASAVGIRAGEEVPIGMVIDESQYVAAQDLLRHVSIASGVIVKQ